MVPFQSVRMDLMSSRDVHAYLKRNDMVLLPVGCFEMHGPKIPLACDAFHAWAQSVLLADLWGCLTLPPIYYTFPGASGPWPGTVDIPQRATLAYVSAVVEAVLKNGFRRVVMVGTHGPLTAPLQCVLRDLFHSTGQIVLHLRPVALPDDLMKKALGYPGGEDNMALASLKVLGMDGAFDPTTHIDKPGGNSSEALHELKRLGCAAPPTFAGENEHTGIRSCVRPEHAEKAVAVMKQALARLADLPDRYTQYQTEMKTLYKERPWDTDEVWSDA